MGDPDESPHIVSTPWRNCLSHPQPNMNLCCTFKPLGQFNTEKRFIPPGKTMEFLAQSDRKSFHFVAYEAQAIKTTKYQ
jgi:hypothetical protein